MRKIAVASFAIALVISSIVRRPLAQTTVPTMLTNPTVIGPGWQCLLTPTAFDGPGTIFSVSPDAKVLCEL